MQGHCEHGWPPVLCETCRSERARQDMEPRKVDPSVDRKERRRLARRAVKDAMRAARAADGQGES